MKRNVLLKTMLLLCAIVVGTSSSWADDYELVTNVSDLAAGDKCLIVNKKTDGSGVALSGYKSQASVTISSSKITLASEDAKVLTLGGNSTEGWSFKNNSNKYVAYSGSSTGLTESNNASQSSKSLWTISINGTSSVATITEKSTSRMIRCYSTTDFRAYANTSNGTDVYLYKKKSATATALAVRTAPTKVNYKVGETLDLTGLVLDATVGGNHVDVTSGYTASPANGATLNTVGAQTVTFTYGGKTTTQTIHVGDLQSISLTTTGVKTEYNEGQTFNIENLVVKATFSDEEDNPTEWEETIDAGNYSFSPSTALSTSDDKVTISYTWNEVEKTADIPISVNAGQAYKVTFNAGTGSCATASLDEASFGVGVELPTATIGLTGWTFAGWAEAAITNTQVAPTLYVGSTTYHPTDNTTLYAVYKYVDGTEGEYKRATTLNQVKEAKTLIVVNSKNSKTLTYDLSNLDALAETDGKVTATTETIFTLSGNDTDGYTLTGNGKTIGALTLPTSNSSSTDIALTELNNKWSVVTCTNNSYPNQFVFINKNGTNVGLEYSSKWLAYKTSSTPASSQYHASKVYIPNFSIAYNSNPATIISPTVAFTTAGNKTLYLKNTKTYDNAANVTGISKTPIYTSSDATIASVSEAGVVTALKVGTTTITAKVAAEVGVNTEATASYAVTVKTASDIAGIKTITDASTTQSFTADLTDAVVTYVKGNRAYIQDASGSIYMNITNHGLTAGTKINGAVSGSVKAPNQIDELTALSLTEATVTDDGVIPGALEVTLATIVANKAEYDGKRVQVTSATVTATLESGQNSGGKISDDGKTTEMNLYAPDGDIEALKDAVGTFTGFISLYGGETPRFNIYEQEWVALTRNAPTDQPLAFESNAVNLDDDSDEFNAFTGQVVSGAQGTVTYTKADENNIIESLNAETGAIVLSGECGTATITATAAAKEVTEADVTTPYKQTIKSYTITVRPRYTVTFNVLGKNIVKRETSFEDGVTAPEIETVGVNVFQGWTDAAITTPTDVKPTTVITTSDFDGLTGDVTYYALFGKETAGTPEETLTQTLQYDTWTYGGDTEDNSTYRIFSKDSYIESESFDLSKLSKVIVFGGGSYGSLPSGHTQQFIIRAGETIWKTTTTSGKSSTNQVVVTSDVVLSGSGILHVVSDCGLDGTSGLRISKVEIYTMEPTIDYNQYTTSPADKANIIVEDADGKKSAESIDLSAMNDITALVGVHADEITYTRTMGKLSTLYLPYASTIPDGMTAYEFNGINVAGTALNFNVVEGTTLNAYTPYVLEQNASASQTLSATDVDIVADTNGEIIKGDWMLKGTVSKIENADLLTEAGTGTPYVVQSDAKWHPVQSNANAYIPAFRAYFIASAGAGAKIMEMNLGGETTSIANLDVNDDLDENAPIFNLAGQKVTKTYKGVVIQNGKKVVRK